MKPPAPPSQGAWTVSARWVFPVDRAPLERGTVTIEQDRIVAVDPRGRRTPDHDLGNVALLPGLVNAHTHLDLTGLRGKCPPSPDFIDWLRAVVRHRRAQTPEQVQADVRAGLAELLRFGTTLVGDIAAGGASWEALAGAALRAVVYYELVGLPDDRLFPGLRAAWSWLRTHPGSGTCRPAWSPHAPYSVSRTLLAATRNQSRSSSLPLAIHLAETLEEKQLLETRSGPFVPLLQELDVWAPSQLAGDWDDALRLTAGGSPVSYVHANYLPVGVALPPSSTIVFCPRTHAAFSHPPHRFPDLLERGIRVALGTDSLASNPDLDVLAETRFAHERYSQVSGEALLRMATLSGAEALGWDHDTGSLAAGKSADMVVLPLPAEERRDPHLLVLESRLPVQAVLWRGRWR
jgi:cytosine/adenosine deaminase-related metal-dependent hydrolase